MLKVGEWRAWTDEETARASQERNIRVVQSKTDEELWIPAHRELTAELGRDVIGHMSLLTTTQGKGFDPAYFGAWSCNVPVMEHQSVRSESKRDFLVIRLMQRATNFPTLAANNARQIEVFRPGPAIATSTRWL
jgi:hypothetical protein